jgi:beta-glucosidase-like glycosyl hydrolase
MNPRKLARLICPGFRFGVTDPYDAIKLAELGVGGFCFYGGNAEDVREASRQLKAASETPLLIASDYENGAGQWVSGATELPSSMAVGASGSEVLARRKGEITALEARALGVDWVLAPVADLATRPDNPIVNVRAFGRDPNLAIRLGDAFMSGLNSQGALSCLKHFPGHGDTAADSHLELPAVNKNFYALDELELKPFRALVRRADAVMAGHLQLPELDQVNPASLSKEIISGLLRRRLGFGGCIVTDALEMKAISSGPQAGVMAFQAGADMLLVPEDPRALLAALAAACNDGLITLAAVEQALARQDQLVRKLFPFRQLPPSSGTLRCREHLAFNAEAAPACLAWASAGRFALKPGDTVGYFEPLTQPGNWRGAAFADQLSVLGVRVEPYQPGCGMRLAAGCFSKPRAGSGSINLAPEERRALEAAIAGAAQSVVLAFGSPFVLDGLAPTAGLCAFCALEEFQRAAADVLAEKISPGGSLPVKVSILERT